MQKRPIFLKAKTTISCFNCRHCVNENEDDDTYICEVSNKQIADGNTDLHAILKCENGKDWKIDKKAALDFMIDDISRYEILDENEIAEALH